MRDNPKNDNRFDNYRLWSEPNNMTIYVHRAPVAIIGLSYSKYNDYSYALNLTNNSYDLDHSSLPNKGISQEVWSYKDLLNPNSGWVNGKPNSKLSGISHLLIKLRVMDMEYTWSETTVEFAPPELESPGVLTVEPMEQAIWVSEKVTGSTIKPIIKYSKPSYVDRLIYRKTTNGQPEDYWNAIGTAYYSGYPVTLGEGEHYLEAKIYDTRGGIQNIQAGPYRIDNTSPIITNVTPSAGEYHNAIRIEISAQDALSGVKFIKYSLTSSSTSPAKDSSSWQEFNSTYVAVPINTTGVYYFHVYASDFAGNESAIITKSYNVSLNKPPVLNIIGTSPSFIYEGDNVKVNFTVADPDLDTLTCSIAVKKGGAAVWTGTKTVSPTSGTYPLVSLPTIQNISTGTYTIDITVRDPAGSTDHKTKNFTTNALSISGKVGHTDLWEEHRQRYNTAARAAGRLEHDYNVFFDGEKFMLHADTTAIDPQSGVTASQVQVEIVGTSFRTSLVKTSTTKFDKGWWEESMPRWGERSLDFLFRAAYSNGTVKTDTVRIYISEDEYWRLHMLF